MKRKALEAIQFWYQSEPQRPLIIQGPKGVGKTRLMTDFLSTYTGNKIYLNLELNPGLLDLLDSENVQHTLQAITKYFAIDASSDTILIFDECNACEFLISQINEYQSQIPMFRFVFISSYPLIQMENYRNESNNYHVISLHPMDFEEFLAASNNHWYISVIKEHYKSSKPIPDIVHKDILNLFYDYLLIGGMPAAINEYISLESILNVSESHYCIQNYQLSSLRQHNSEASYVKLESLYQTLDQQLSKKNKKFKYNLIRKGATKNQYLAETKTLEDYGIILPCLPLGSDTIGQKMYLYDVGILVSKAKMNTFCKELSTNTELYKGIIENYVAESLVSKGYSLYFWESGSQAKIDFILKKEESYIPIEVYSNEHTKSKAVSIFSNSYPMSYSIKVSPKNFSKNHNTQYVPLYAVFCI